MNIESFDLTLVSGSQLVTYRETALLIDPKFSSMDSRQRVAIVVAHELAHQWFGNLVVGRFRCTINGERNKLSLNSRRWIGGLICVSQRSGLDSIGDLSLLRVKRRICVVDRVSRSGQMLSGIRYLDAVCRGYVRRFPGARCIEIVASDRSAYR